MKFSDNGIKLLKRLEGRVKNGDRHVIYDDKSSKMVNIDDTLPRGATIGYGHLIKSGEDFRNGISESKATDLLRQDIVSVERVVQRCIKSPLNQNQYDALVLLAYNIGGDNFMQSTVVKYINNPEFRDAKYATLESAWMAWNKSRGREINGLKHRRAQEWILFNA